MLFALSNLVKVPRNECDDTEGSNDEEHEDDYEEGSAECRRLCIAGAECVVMVVVHLDDTAWIGWGICINNDTISSFAGLWRC